MRRRMELLAAAFALGGAGLFASACGKARAQQRGARGTRDTTLSSAPNARANGIALPAGNDNGQGSGEWTMPGRDFGGTRYSPLTDINVSNVKNLKVATTFSTSVLHGHEGQPLVIGSTMYVVTPFPNLLYSIDLTKP
ncbi:MAG TPA: hypothetical protein VH277_12515, partial [Gemmatimonadaceae bacterium]|nr:hypothetical protein [Gemmatimonadaceae bacterium]